MDVFTYWLCKIEKKKCFYAKIIKEKKFIHTNVNTLSWAMFVLHYVFYIVFII